MKISLKQLELPPDTTQLPAELVPAVRNLLGRGLPEGFMRSCVRFGLFKPFRGGYKSSLVGGLRIDIHAVLKNGNDELHHHAAMMKYINGLRSRTFPAILKQVKVADGEVFLLMEELRKYVTLLDKVYAETTTKHEFNNILATVFDSFRLIHSVTNPCAALSELPKTPEPFVQRLRKKLACVIKNDPELACIMKHPGQVNGQHCPPLNQLLLRAQKLAKPYAAKMRLCLIHGDPHLGNIMVRKNGRHAYRVRLIDPNPMIGFSQPLYDLGKLLHWVEPVGWTQIKPKLCHVRWHPLTRNTRWRLDARIKNASASAEKRRLYIESMIHRFSEEYRGSYGGSFDGMLALAIASAHIGLAAILNKRKDKMQRRFVLAYALRQLNTLR